MMWTGKYFPRQVILPNFQFVKISRKATKVVKDNFASCHPMAQLSNFQFESLRFLPEAKTKFVKLKFGKLTLPIFTAPDDAVKIGKEAIFLPAGKLACRKISTR